MFAEITMINYSRPLADRKEARKHAGPYKWRPAAPSTGRGFYMNGRGDAMDARGSTFDLRVIEDPKGEVWRTEDSDSEFHPIVLRLPRGRGFLAGWSMGAGMCASVDAHIWDDEDDAMRAARNEAESAADRECEYQADWRAGSDYAELGEEIAATRRSILDVLAERRLVRHRETETPALCAALRERVGEMLDSIAEARSKRAELIEYREHNAAFRDGADLA